MSAASPTRNQAERADKTRSRILRAASPTRTQAERADQTRSRILVAAVSQFSENGLAGARMDLIAEAAAVNKALLYYYFRSKEMLYQAALESVAEGVRASGLAVLEGNASAGERFLCSTLNHFDRIYTNREFQSLMQQEMIRLHRGEVNALSPLVEKVFRPLTDRTQRVLEEGIRSGELIRADPSQMRYAALGANILYFLSAPLMHLVQGSDPLESSALKSRRSSAIQYLGLALFTDRKHGMKVARRVLAATPMPAHGGLPPRSATEFPGKKKHAVRHT